MDSLRIPWADRLRGPKNPLLPAPSSSLSTLSNQQLLHQAARVLRATSSGLGLKPEGRVPPKPSGSEARALPAEAHVPLKPSGPALSSSPPLDMVPHNRVPSTLESLSTGTLLSYAHHLAGLPLKDRSLRPLVQLVGCHLPLTPASSSELDLENIVKEEPPPFDALVSACYKKVTNCICLVRTTLPEEYCIVRRIPSDLLLSLPVLLTHPPDFIPSEKFTKERREKMNINVTGFLWPEEEKLILFLIKAQEDGIAWDASERGSF